jgi:hypothetical protein
MGPHAPELQGGRLLLKRDGSSTPVLFVAMTKARREALDRRGPHLMADAALQEGFSAEAQARLALARAAAPACPDAAPLRAALRALARGAFENRPDGVLQDADVRPGLDAPTTAHGRIAALADLHAALSAHRHPAARRLARLLAAP